MRILYCGDIGEVVEDMKNKKFTRKSLLLRENLKEAERETIHDALQATKGNKRQACRILGISRSGLYEKLDLYGINTKSSIASKGGDPSRCINTETNK